MEFAFQYAVAAGAIVERIDVALIGAGRMGRIHGPHAAATAGLRLKYVVDPRPGAADEFRDRYGARQVDLDAALGDPAVGGVLVCSTTDQHLGHALAAVAAGKAVFCEKPIDLDLAKVRAARPKFEGARFLLGFNRRFDPEFLALKQRIDAGDAGPVESLHIVNHDPASPPPGFIPTSGGLFRDFTIHDLDMVRWLLGEEPEQVYATASCLVDPGIGALGDVDTARTLLRMPSGRLCVISNTRRSGCGYDQRIEAFCARGLLAAGNRRRDNVRMLTDAGESAAPIQPAFPERYRDAYRAQIEHFADVVQGRAQALVGYDDGVAALVLADACAASMRDGAPVRPTDLIAG
jgi:myo-inositol 2-dehydrogenase/D-chiro-inositol 1-dehydrogenase